MTTKTRLVSKLALCGLIAAPMIASCGLRGGLERPDPVFRKVTPIEASAPPPKESSPTPDVRPRATVNEFGGDIPEAAPTEPVQSAPLEENVPAPEDDTEE